MSMKNSTIGIVIILIAVIAVGAYALTSTSSLVPGQTVAAANDKATKLDMHNNDPNNWCHVDLVFNATSKNGTTQTWYVEMFAKPNGNTTLDLSNLLGYGNEKLPPMNITIISWKGVLNTTSGGTGDLNLYLQGWSNTAQPGSGDQKYNITYPGVPVGQLFSQIKDNYVLATTNQTQAATLDNDADEVIFEQEILTVDSTGKVTLNIVIAPTLCTTLAPHPA
jgi:hypothetical protein